MPPCCYISFRDMSIIVLIMHDHTFMPTTGVHLYILECRLADVACSPSRTKPWKDCCRSIHVFSTFWTLMSLM